MKEAFSSPKLVFHKQLRLEAPAGSIYSNPWCFCEASQPSFPRHISRGMLAGPGHKAIYPPLKVMKVHHEQKNVLYHRKKKKGGGNIGLKSWQPAI